MSKYGGDDCDDEVYSVIADEGEVGFLDFQNDSSQSGYEPTYDAPVSISNIFELSHGKPRSGQLGQTCVDTFTLRNNSRDPVELWSVRIFASDPKDSFILSLMRPPSDDSDEETIENFVGSTSLEDRVLQPGQTLIIWLSCKPKEIGMHTSIVHFDVGDEKIEKVAFLLAEDSVSRSLASNKSYSRTPRRNTFPVNRFVAGSRPERANTTMFKNKLDLYLIPAHIRELLENKQIPDVIMEGLHVKNYSEFFSALIVMEEINLEEEMRGYDMKCVYMRKRSGNFLSLEVRGLAEKRPSLVCGDYIFVKLTSNSKDDGCHPYQGFIHKVEADEIFLRFENEMQNKHREDNLYDVRFTYNRLNMRRQYQAVHEAERLAHEILFPPQSFNHRVIKDVPFIPISRNINKEQELAVGKILGCRGYPPYVIHGPPGTGKTMTLVEAILQVYLTRKDARILVCGSSNSAADHVLENIISQDGLVQDKKLFRLNAPSRSYDDVRPDFIQYCNIVVHSDNMVFSCPPPKVLSCYSIIVSTYMSSSQIYSVGIKRGHFTHIFLDEAGQASEPETMIPLANLCSRKTVVVLAGDPMQLGPTIYSRVAENYGLGKSYLERLFEFELYGKGDRNFVTKLVRNYRCHPAILDLPSRLFYRGQLIASKEEEESSFYNLLNLPNNSFPVLFVGIQGCDEREGNNPSWFNRIEASKVVELISKIKRTTNLHESEIGVITPYRQQVLKIEKALSAMEIIDVKVGSVEKFQGQERKVIIISTVRSTVKHNEFDRVYNLGFLSNPKRFNVAVTRAKSLLIIVGNPHIIIKDRNWEQLLWHCADNGSYQGCPLPQPDPVAPAPDAMPGYDRSGVSNSKWNDYSTDKQKWETKGAEWNDYSTAKQKWATSGAEWNDYTTEEQKRATSSAEWNDCTSEEQKGDTSIAEWNGCTSEDPKWEASDVPWDDYIPEYNPGI